MNKPAIRTLGELKQFSYRPRSVKEEMKANLIQMLNNGQHSLPGIKGYEQTVQPQIERAILAQHNILLLGLRGQAKSKMARLLVHLLDPFIPVLKGSPLNEDPFMPLTETSRNLIEAQGDDTVIDWLSREQRLVEKLATPDVSVADLIGDIDPIKAANLKLSYADEGAIHFGLVPRANRGLFVINELPDLQPRIQVALFNILQEKDIQIRGFNIRLPLDVQFIFTANPEDYTNRGSIITPLKDRMESQIITHYPLNEETAAAITDQEANISSDLKERVHVPALATMLLERIVTVARNSEFIDQTSGVSARLGISAWESLMAAAEYRLIRSNLNSTTLRVTDFIHIIPAMTGKLELTYEGEQQGAVETSVALMEEALDDLVQQYLPDPDQVGDTQVAPYGAIQLFIQDNELVRLKNEMSDEQYQSALNNIPGTSAILKRYFDTSMEDKYFMIELLLHGMSSYDLLDRDINSYQTDFNRNVSLDDFDDII